VPAGAREATEVDELERQLVARMDELRPVAVEFVRLWALLDAIDGRDLLPVPTFLDDVVATVELDVKRQRQARERQQRRMAWFVEHR
jgi:hypothetical protein